jgi:ribosome-associated translation inhibitor RaiA
MEKNDEPLVLVEWMRIDVIAEDETITAQVRAYAEYRLFATLARYSQLVRSVRVVLQRGGRDRTANQIVCAITVALEPSGYARARASKPLAYGAIHRATERIGDLMSRRTARRRSS